MRYGALVLVALASTGCQKTHIFGELDAALDADLDARPVDAAPDLGPDAEPPLPCVVSPAVVTGEPGQPLVIGGPRDARLTRWQWSIVRQPPEAQALLAEHINDNGVASPDVLTTPEVTFRGDAPGEYGLALEVHAIDGAACPPIDLTVHLEPGPGLYLSLRWAPEADLDLVLTHPDGPCPASDTEPRPAGVGVGDPLWGDPDDVDDDPQRDAVGPARGRGPETIRLRRPELGTYRVYVRGFLVDTPVTAAVGLWWNGAQLQMHEGAVAQSGRTWSPVALQFDCAGCAPTLLMGAGHGEWGECPAEAE